jgi:hypothetical protein
MKTHEEIIKENPHTIRRWENSNTLDIVVDDLKKPFAQEVAVFKCLCCDNNIIAGNEKFLVGLDPNTKGAKLKCHKCNQIWFIHKPVTSD